MLVEAGVSVGVDGIEGLVAVEGAVVLVGGNGVALGLGIEEVGTVSCVGVRLATGVTAVASDVHETMPSEVINNRVILEHIDIFDLQQNYLTAYDNSDPKIDPNEYSFQRGMRMITQSASLLPRQQ